MDYFSLDKNITAGVQRRIPARFGGIEVQKPLHGFLDFLCSLGHKHSPERYGNEVTQCKHRQ